MAEVESASPCGTLYVSNLPTSKVNVQTQRKMLFMLFNYFGKVLEVRATKGRSKRGQAWVSFESEAAATAALDARQGFNFFDKPLKLSYAKAKSDVLSKADGSFVAREKPIVVSEEAGQPRKRRRKSAASAAAAGGAVAVGGGDVGSAGVRKASAAALAIPNRILFATGLNPITTGATLTEHFQAFVGFMEVRMVPGNKGMAFVEFSSEDLSAPALVQSQKKSFDGYMMQLSYAKK